MHILLTLLEDPLLPLSLLELSLFHSGSVAVDSVAVDPSLDRFVQRLLVD